MISLECGTPGAVPRWANATLSLNGEYLITLLSIHDIPGLLVISPRYAFMSGKRVFIV